MTDKAKKVEDVTPKTVYTFPEFGFSVEADTIEEATKIAEKKAKGNKE